MKNVMYILSFVTYVFLIAEVKGQAEKNVNNLTGIEMIEEYCESAKFDYSFYEEYKGQLINLEDFEIESGYSRLESNNIILDQINRELGTQLSFSRDFKELELNTEVLILDWIENHNIMNEKEIQIISDFSRNLINSNLEEALIRLEEDVEKRELSSVEMAQFQYFANVVKVIEYQDNDFFVGAVQAFGCAEALTGLAFASAALVGACNPPALGATVGWPCYLAGANFIRASIAVGNACGD